MSSSSGGSGRTGHKAGADKKVGMRPSEQDLKDMAFKRSIFNIINQVYLINFMVLHVLLIYLLCALLYQDHTCPPSCPLKGQCLSSVLFLDVMKEMTWFWGGDYNKKAYSTSDRKNKIIDKMKRSVFKNTSQKKPVESSNKSNNELHLIFTIGSTDVCENVYLQLIGHPSTKMWLRCKTAIFNSYTQNNGFISEAELKSIDAAVSMKRHKLDRRPQPKADNARSFITYLMQFYASMSPNEGEEHIRILPFEKVSQLYEEYRAHYKATSLAGDEYYMASKETFRKQWSEFYRTGQVKLSRGKGTFPTCDICNNANDMLTFSKSSKWTKKQRDIIISFKV